MKKLINYPGLLEILVNNYMFCCSVLVNSTYLALCVDIYLEAQINCGNASY